MQRASFALPSKQQCTPLWIAAQENKPECIAVLAAAKASIDATSRAGATPIAAAAHNDGAESVRLLAYLGARLTDGDGDLFTCYFNENKGKSRVFDPEVWKTISREGGDDGTAKSLRKRIRMLKDTILESAVESAAYGPTDHGDID